jgi:hypothetical protein
MAARARKRGHESDQHKAAASWRDYEDAAIWLKNEFLAIANQWIRFRSFRGNARKKEQSDLYWKLRLLIDKNLKNTPPQWLPYPGCLTFPARTLKTPRQEAQYELWLLVLQTVASEWAPHLYCCPECQTFFVSKRTSAKEPRCSRRCNAASRKRAQRNRDLQAQINAANEAVLRWEKLPKAERPKDWRSFVAREASLRLPRLLKFSKTWVTLRTERRELDPPKGEF